MKNRLWLSFSLANNVWRLLDSIVNPNFAWANIIVHAIKANRMHFARWKCCNLLAIHAYGYILYMNACMHATGFLWFVPNSDPFNLSTWNRLEFLSHTFIEEQPTHRTIIFMRLILRCHLWCFAKILIQSVIAAQHEIDWKWQFLFLAYSMPETEWI